MRTFRLLSVAVATVGIAAQVSAVAAMPPIYLVVDFVPKQAPVPGKAGNRRVVIVRAFNDGDAGACARAQMRFPNTATSPNLSHCVRELPAEFAPVLRDAAVPKAYVLKFTLPQQPGPSYRLMYDMATSDPPQICRNLVDYQRKFGDWPPDARIQCWVPRI